MANTVKVNRDAVIGGEKGVYATVDITSYTTDGEAVSAGALGLKNIRSLAILSPCNGNAMLGASGSKILAYGITQATGAIAQVVATTNVGKVDILALGT